MDTRSKILITLILFVFVGISVWKYYIYFVKRDFVISTVVSCDTRTESCFAAECQPGDEECDAEPYKKLEIKASDMVVCDKYTDASCPEPSCALGNEQCFVTLCEEDTLEEGEVCVPVEVGSAENTETNNIEEQI